jgi:Autographiviridae endonuclease VII
MYYDKAVWRARRYGITLERFDELVREQNNRCAICEVDLGDGRRRQIDHDHATKRVRALLCPGCNGALGHIERLGIERFAAYLDHHRALAGHDLTT